MSSQPDQRPIPEPNYKASLDFLSKWMPRGPWVLTAIVPDKPKKGAATFTDTFGQHDVNSGRLLRWLEEHGTQRRRNIYFTPNGCRKQSVKKKPSKTDIAGLYWLHVDLDPRAGEDRATERERIFKLLQDPTHLGIPKPSVIVDSGNGGQAFWRLRVPEILDGTDEAADDAGLWNRRLGDLLGGDATHNVDRVMRLPSTVNWPDKRKREKGRVPVLAAVVEFNDGLHDLDGFKKAEPVRVPASAPSSNGRAPAGTFDAENVKRFASVNEIEELRDARYAQCRVVIVQGLDPDDPDKFKGSRSEWLFFACCEMVRAGCSDEAIYAVITDPSFGVSESVLDKGSGIEEYAWRQIERAREEAVDPILREINDEYALVTVGGKARVLREHWDAEFERATVSYMLKEAFLDFWNKRSVEYVSGTDGNGKPKVVSEPAGKWWTRHPLGRAYRDVVYAPGRALPRDVMNLWRGFAVSPSAEGTCERYLEHLRKNVCRGVEEHYDYLIRWMAHAVQRPSERGHVAVVLRGDKGTGKGVTAAHFGALWGGHFVAVTNPKHVTEFNSLIEAASVLFLDECLRPKKDDVHESILKALTTEETVPVERKGIDVLQRKNVLHLILASNAPWIVNASGDERRYFFLHVGDGNRQDHAYFEAMEAEMLAGGYGALLHMLLGMDLSGFNVRRAPKTEALREQVEFSLDAEDEWLLTLLLDGELPNHVKGEANRAWVSDDGWRPGGVFVGYGLLEHARRVVPKLRDATDNALCRYLTRVGATCPEGWGRRSRVFPPLPVMRAAWCERHGPRDWPGGADADWTLQDPGAEEAFNGDYGS